MKQATLLFCRRDNEVLLAMKKRGFGEGFWNGVGGKAEPPETIEETAIRECQEEVGITPRILSKVAILDFCFLDDETRDNWNQQVHVFSCTEWQGQPLESEEMAPQWFAPEHIPYDTMWPSDRIWLPEVLAGKFVTASFHLAADGSVVRHQASAVPL